MSNIHRHDRTLDKLWNWAVNPWLAIFMSAEKRDRIITCIAKILLYENNAKKDSK